MNAARLTHPGVILKREMDARGWSQRQLAKKIGTSQGYISEILHGHRGLSALMAISLGRIFDTTAEFWWNLQCTYDLAKAREKEG